MGHNIEQQRGSKSSFSQVWEHRPWNPDDLLRNQPRRRFHRSLRKKSAYKRKKGAIGVDRVDDAIKGTSAEDKVQDGGRNSGGLEKEITSKSESRLTGWPYGVGPS